jgi:hypothetical protein
MDNPEMQATLDTRHKMKTNKTTQKNKKMNNKDLTKNNKTNISNVVNQQKHGHNRRVLRYKRSNQNP